MAGIELEGIRKSFGPTAVLKGVSLAIADGEFLSLVGPSGCGKSTLLRIIAGLEVQDAGRIRIGSRAVEGIAASARNLAMVFQSYALYPHLTVAENIAVPLRMRRLSGLQRLPLVGGLLPGSRRERAAIDAAVRSAAEILDIGHLLQRKPAQLSGGQRQRVAVGRALVREPEAFLLDEPLSNLDAKLRVHMRSEIAGLHRRLATTFVYVTHDQAEAMTMSDRIAVMLDGELLQVATPHEVYHRPADRRVAEFIGSPKINLLPAAIGGDGAVTLLGLPTGRVALEGQGQAALAGLRPEALHETRGRGLAGRVVHLENLGSEIFLHVAVEGLEAPLVVRREPEPDGSHAAPRLADGPVTLDFDARRLVLFDRQGRALPLRAAPRQDARPRAEAAHG
ncbi:carbohydrate ABC transporter ATP-binding protein, CUT1 family [Tistlia consotensis]|uniref:Carbohydrate ABC transporter ATP-binding protein, CUT1 family n=1 Tax=Tistlia consotensis USBA 355 TaxID=560819 RepID=A0A1Y6B9V7_9PROT|nr:ABC transporter ATP-binding protein [Tistlia consotensis]SMF00511.1 carbohydrate ABC transporter ATP-binding protein, CUT1 family [Tistlia consotensis USBA 355]SNR75752.1 carbohydrate ABC transporter ATP-binding protein, CUT1 family [Tistlia consotensis]